MRLVRIDPPDKLWVDYEDMRTDLPAQIAGSRCKGNKQSLSDDVRSPRVTPIGGQRPFTASLLGFLKDVRTEVMPY